MTSLLIQREYFSLTPIQNIHEVLPLHNLELRQEYRALYMGGERVGFSTLTLDKLDSETFKLRYQTYFPFLFLGREKEMLVKGSAKTDPFLHLWEFEQMEF